MDDRGVTPPGDALLAQRAAQGDLDAFDVLVRRYQLPIYRVCLNILGDTHAAQDAAQDTFFTAWRAIGRYRGDAKLSTWLYRIATNRCLKELKRRERPTDPLPDLPSTAGTPEEHYEAVAHVADVAGALARLPADQRVAMLLRDVEGLAYGDIAEVLGVSMTVVKSRIYRARLQLARRLGDQ